MTKQKKVSRSTDSASRSNDRRASTETRKGKNRFRVGEVVATIGRQAFKYIRVGSKHWDEEGRLWCFHDNTGLAYLADELRRLTQSQAKRVKRISDEVLFRSSIERSR